MINIKGIGTTGWITILFFLTMACHEQNKNKVSPAELMKAREIKKVSEAEILQKGDLIGNEVLKHLNSLEVKHINSDTMQCDFNQWMGLDSLKENYDVDIQRISSKSSQLSELELQLLSAYQYNLENELEATASIQKLDAKTIIFAFPVDVKSMTYTFCLDSLEKQEAHIWSIRIPIKEVIHRL